MRKEEIDQYIQFSSRSSVCVYREQLKQIPLMVMSLNITGSPGKYILTAEFDPYNMVDEGEGWIWFAKFSNFDDMIERLQFFMDLKNTTLENITKSGKLVSSLKEVDDCDYEAQEEAFLHEYKKGEVFLPKSISWQYK